MDYDKTQILYDNPLSVLALYIGKNLNLYIYISWSVHAKRKKSIVLLTFLKQY